MRAHAPALGWLGLALGALVLTGCGGGKGERPGAGPDPKERPGDLYVELSAEYLQRGQLEPALDRAQYALRMDPKNGRAHYMLAIVEQRLGRIKESEQAFAEAVRLEPDNPDFRNAWGYVLCSQGRFDEALREMQQAADDPLNKNADIALMNAAACAKRARRDTQADTFLRTALSRDPNFAPALLALARRDYERGSYQEARALLARYGRVGEPIPEAILLAVQIERQLGNAAGARALENALKQRYPNAPETQQL